MKIHLRPEQIQEYKNMSKEDIILKLKSRNPNILEQDIINCGEWINDECD